MTNLRAQCTIVAVGDYTPHQRKIIDRYYDNRDDIMLAKLSEIVSDLYLATSEAAAKRLWTRADTAMKNLKIPDPVRTHILASGKVDVLAKNLRDWLGKKK